MRQILLGSMVGCFLLMTSSFSIAGDQFKSLQGLRTFTIIKSYTVTFLDKNQLPIANAAFFLGGMTEPTTASTSSPPQGGGQSTTSSNQILISSAARAVAQQAGSGSQEGSTPQSAPPSEEIVGATTNSQGVATFIMKSKPLWAGEYASDLHTKLVGLPVSKPPMGAVGDASHLKIGEDPGNIIVFQYLSSGSQSTKP